MGVHVIQSPMLAGALDAAGQGLVDINLLDACLVLGVLDFEGDVCDGKGLAGHPTHTLLYFDNTISTLDLYVYLSLSHYFSFILYFLFFSLFLLLLLHGRTIRYRLDHHLQCLLHNYLDGI